MLTPCACGHHVRRHGPAGCTVDGCGCQTPHDALARRLHRHADPHRISAVWARQADDLTYHAVGVVGDRRGTPPPRTPAICQPSAAWGRWRRPYELKPLDQLRCVVCLQALPRWNERMAADTPPIPSTPTTMPSASPLPLPLAAFCDPREPGAVYVRLSVDPRRADYSARDIEAALARLR